jgi:hypothetical protein
MKEQQEDAYKLLAEEFIKENPEAGGDDIAREVNKTAYSKTFDQLDDEVKTEIILAAKQQHKINAVVEKNQLGREMNPQPVSKEDLKKLGLDESGNK